LRAIQSEWLVSSSGGGACALNHPNIAAIFGAEEHALVMEPVEGESLKGPLPVETALDYARHIADAESTGRGFNPDSDLGAIAGEFPKRRKTHRDVEETADNNHRKNPDEKRRLKKLSRVPHQNCSINSTHKPRVSACDA
jgi:hypothetical protein